MYYLLVLLSFARTSAQATDRIVIHAKINNQQVRLAFDSGTQHSMLFKNAAERLGLKVLADKPHSPQTTQESFAPTEECDFSLSKSKVRFGIIETPDYLSTDLDGLIGWNSARNKVIHYEAARNVCWFSDSAITNLDGRLECIIPADATQLVFRESKNNQVIGIDTGSGHGVWLSRKKWTEWSKAHANAPRTLEAGWIPGQGLVVSEVFRAREILIGQIKLVDVPVSLAPVSAEHAFGAPDAIFGLYVFKRLEPIIDGRNRRVFVRKNAISTNAYAYNRLGAIFLPSSTLPDAQLIARVVEGGPAYRSGIRNGDSLTGINDLDVRKWRTDRRILPLSRFWNQASGVGIRLALRRNDEAYEVPVVLEELGFVD